MRLLAGSLPLACTDAMHQGSNGAGLECACEESLPEKTKVTQQDTWACQRLCWQAAAPASRAVARLPARGWLP